MTDERALSRVPRTDAVVELHQSSPMIRRGLERLSIEVDEPTTPPTTAPAPVAATPALVPGHPSPAPASNPAVHADGALTVEQLADLWPRIRQDAKARNRRIEALLASVDPVRVTGDVVTLVAAYPFHRDKLNSDEVRGVVESVITRLAGRPITVQCVLREDLPATAPAPLRAERNRQRLTEAEFEGLDYDDVPF